MGSSGGHARGPFPRDIYLILRQRMMSGHWLEAMPAAASGASSSSALPITGLAPRLRAAALARPLPWTSCPARRSRFDHLRPRAALIAPESPDRPAAAGIPASGIHRRRRSRIPVRLRPGCPVTRARTSRAGRPAAGRARPLAAECGQPGSGRGLLGPHLPGRRRRPDERGRFLSMPGHVPHPGDENLLRLRHPEVLFYAARLERDRGCAL